MISRNAHRAALVRLANAHEGEMTLAHRSRSNSQRLPRPTETIPAWAKYPARNGVFL